MVAIHAWVILELALMATDLAEVLGSAIALNLLFGIPIMVSHSGDNPRRLPYYCSS